MRLAFFTPFAPVRSGISAYSAELLPSLAAAHEVDVYVEDAVWDHWARRATGRPPNLTRSGAVALRLPNAPAAVVTDATAGALPDAGDAGAGAAAAIGPETMSGAGSGPQATAALWRAHDFVPRHLRTPYDLIVYQLGNATCHEFMWPYLMRYPGLVVLHDGQLHHARAHALLRRNRKADYLAEFTYAHPDTPPDLAEFVIAGLQGPVYYMWPLVAAVVRRAHVVAVHNARLADDLREAFPEAAIDTIRMGVPAAPAIVDTPTIAAAPATPNGQPISSTPPIAAAATIVSGPTPHGAPGIARRQTGGASNGTIRFAAFGLVTPEKRIPQALRALAAIVAVAPGARLTLVGETTEHYDVRADAAALGIADRVDITGYVSDEELASHVAAADVCLCLRWPTARETSASWLRCLAAGKATIVNDLTHLVDVPTLDPRTWTLLHARTDAAAVERPPAIADAAAVGIDILDEDHSLALAMRRLARDTELRDSLGRAARRLWASNHTLSVMAEDYARAIARAVARPAPDPGPVITPAPGTGTEPAPIVGTASTPGLDTSRALGTATAPPARPAPPALPPHLLEDHTGHGRRLAAAFGLTLEW